MKTDSPGSPDCQTWCSPPLHTSIEQQQAWSLIAHNQARPADPQTRAMATSRMLQQLSRASGAYGGDNSSHPFLLGQGLGAQLLISSVLLNRIWASCQQGCRNLPRLAVGTQQVHLHGDLS